MISLQIAKGVLAICADEYATIRKIDCYFWQSIAMSYVVGGFSLYHMVAPTGDHVGFALNFLRLVMMLHDDASFFA
jgi:hypothetical protein